VGTGWSLAWKAALYARLLDGEKAYEFVKKQLRLSENTGYDNFNGGGVYTNFFGSCPPFVADSNFGTPAAIIEMLLQCDTDALYLIPALPQEWRNISVSGMHAKSNRKVSFTVRNGVLTECEIWGNKPSKIFVAGNEATDLFVKNQNGYVLNKSN
jgi:alpha-L-fucosidase 2